MAKYRGLFDVNGSVGNLTFISSKKLGDYVRAKRRPGPVNDVLKANSGNTAKVNLLAKAINDAFHPHRKNVYDGTCWARLLAFSRSQFPQPRRIEWEKLRRFEFNEKQKLRNIINDKVVYQVAGGARRTIDIVVETQLLDKMSNKRADGYDQTIIAVFLNNKHKATVMTAEETFMASKAMQSQSIRWTIPPKTEVILIALKCELGKGGETLERIGMKGMAMVEVIV